MKLNRISIVDIPSPGQLGGVTSELILALTTQFKKHGIKVSYQRNQIKSDIPNIIFGWYRCFINESQSLGRLPKNCFIFNLSPLSMAEESSWFNNYTKSLANNHIIDYSILNQKIIQQLGNNSSFRFKFGYTKLSHFNFPDKNKNLIFYGKVTDYRKSQLEMLIKKDYPLQVLTNSWGHERDLQIATSSAVINIPKFDKNILEIYRIWHSLCLGTSVISESGLDLDLVAEWQNYITFFNDIKNYSGQKSSLVNPNVYKNNTSFEESCDELIA